MKARQYFMERRKDQKFDEKIFSTKDSEQENNSGNEDSHDSHGETDDENNYSAIDYDYCDDEIDDDELNLDELHLDDHYTHSSKECKDYIRKDNRKTKSKLFT